MLIISFLTETVLWNIIYSELTVTEFIIKSAVYNIDKQLTEMMLTLNSIITYAKYIYNYITSTYNILN